MSGVEISPNLSSKLEQVKSNLKAWRFSEWVIFWGIIPVMFLVIYSFPPSIKDDYFVLNTSYPWRLQAYFLSSYTHSQLYPHLLGNLAFYFVALLMIFAFEGDRRRFRIMAGWAFLAVPFVSSFLTILFWGFLGRGTTGQGFSAVIGALLAYAMFIFVVWGLQERLSVFDHPELFAGSGARFTVLKVLLTVILVLIMVMGLLSGIFMDAGGSVSNGIAHFGGFVTSLLILFLFDERTENRRFFDTMLGTSILVGVVVYLYYLVLIVRLVRGS
jgi:hypothetical protein